jgi:glycosyltransferase involved in cell wall biosynthesis
VINSTPDMMQEKSAPAHAWEVGRVAVRPFFSVITPSWNQAKFLKGCIESVLDQNDPDFEHLVFDNCSTDGSEVIASAFPHLQFVREKDRGQSDAVNKGLRAAQGEIICWLNSDDEYALGAFRKLRQAFENPDTHVVFGDVRQIGYEGADNVVARAKFARREDFVRWWSGEVKLHQPAIFFRRSVLEKVGFLREDLHYAMDYEFWWRMSEFFKFESLPEVLAVQHRQPESKTIVAWQKVLQERERIFSPHYGLIDGGDRPRLLREMRQALSRIYLQQAYAVVGTRKTEALQLLLRSFAQWPKSLLDFSWVGILRRVVF